MISYSRNIVRGFILIFISLFAVTPAFAQLSVNGNIVKSPNGSRFIFSGVNLEFYRDSGCKYVTDYTWTQKDQIVQTMKNLGINAIRMDYTAAWLGQGTNINQFLDLMQLFAQNGMYVMPNDHTFTGSALTGMETASFPLFQQIVQGARSRGIEPFLLMNPYNEPYGTDPNASTWSNWISANKTTLQYLRSTLNFRGIVVLDTKDWAISYDQASLQAIQTYDASLLGGHANVIFSHHWYPNIGLNSFNTTINAAGVMPLLIGEVGQYNETPLDPTYVKTILSTVVTTGIPNGHNGVFPWIWAWCDDNDMTAAWDNLTTLSSYGNLINDNYYSKIKGILSTLPSPKPSSALVVESSPSVVPTPSSAIPNAPDWLYQTPPKIRNFLELLYTTVVYFQRPSNLAYLLDGWTSVTPTPTHSPTAIPSAIPTATPIPPTVSSIRTYPRELPGSNPQLHLIETQAPVGNTVFIRVDADPSVAAYRVDWYINGTWANNDDTPPFYLGRDTDGVPNGFTIPSGSPVIRAAVYYSGWNYIETSTTYQP